MFGRLGDLVYKWRWIVLAVMVGVLAVLGLYGTTLADHLSSGGLDDPASQSSRAARLIDDNFERDHGSDALVLYYAPPGKTIYDEEFKNKVVASLNRLPKENPAITQVVAHCWLAQAAEDLLCSKDRTVGAAAIAIKGDTDTESLKSYREVQGAFAIDGVKTEVAGRLMVAGTVNDTIAEDTQRMEIIALPVVGILLFFIFGGVVAAALPLIVGGLTVVSAWGLVRVLTHFTEVNSFVSSVVSLIGLGLAIDYGLFIVSRFREELAEGYSTPDAVRRSVMTAGRTVVFSATMIVASLGGMLIFPQGFLKSMAYGSIITVSLAAFTAITVLPAMLAILGKRVDSLGFKFMRKTKSIDEVERSIWGRLTEWVMRHPLVTALPIIVGLLLLIIPVRGIEFGSISEKYLPPDNETRQAQENFDKYFPLRSEPIRVAVETDSYDAAAEVMRDTVKTVQSVKYDERSGVTPKGNPGSDAVPARTIWTFNLVMKNGSAATTAEVDTAIDELRAMPVPENAEVSIGGMRAIERDSISSLLRLMPWMIILVLFTTTLLMFLTFGSLVLPIKAALMSALGLGSTLGILTWIFVDGHGASLLNFTPNPISSPVLVLIIAIIYGLSTDYEVFLLSRMVEARAMGASTTESVRVGTAHTGRIITAAAVILLVVTGAFGFSKLVMMQYIAYGMMAALIIDATLLRMFLVPATMKLLGDDCWWAPAWMKRIQEKSGMGEPILDDARMPDNVPEIISRVNPMLADESMTVEMPGLASVLRAKAGRAFGRNTGANPVVRPGKTGPGRAVAPRATEQQSPPPKRGEGKPPAAPNGGSGPLPRPAPPGGSGPLPRPANGSGPVPRPVNSSGPVPRPAPGPAPAERPAPPSGSGPLRRPQPPAGAASAPVRRPAPGSGPVAGPQPPRRPGPPPGPRGSGPMPRPGRPPAGPAAPPPAGPVPPPRPAGRPANGGPADPLRPAPPPQRSGIEQWLADLRQPGRDPGAAGPQPRSQPETDAETTGRHHRNSQSVSVNELLRREHDD